MTENDGGEDSRSASEAGGDTISTVDSSGTGNRLVTVVLLVVLVLLLIALVYVSLTPTQPANPYTEFYLLGPDGEASNYPTNLEPGEKGVVSVGITNHEGVKMTYYLRVVIRNRTVATRNPTLSNEETWENKVSFQLETTGRYRIRFLLYKAPPSDSSGDPYLTTRLLVTVGTETDTPVTIGDRSPTDTDLLSSSQDIIRRSGLGT